MALVRWSPDADPASPDAFVARAFGARLDDLSVDFHGPLDAAIGGVLRVCLSDAGGRAFEGREIAEWTLPKRRQGLIAVAVATEGPMRARRADCPAPTCGAQAELLLDLREFRRDWRADRTEAVLPGGRRLALRLPRPADLATAAEGGARGAEAAARALALGEAPDGDDWIEAADAALSAADLLGDLDLNADCPACGGPISVPLALEPWLSGELARASVRLMDEIHVIAAAYHWTEADILALPEGRRRHYISRIMEGRAA